MLHYHAKSWLTTPPLGQALASLANTLAYFYQSVNDDVKKFFFSSLTPGVSNQSLFAVNISRSLLDKDKNQS